VTLAEVKTAIEQLSFEERAERGGWLHGWDAGFPYGERDLTRLRHSQGVASQ